MINIEWNKYIFILFSKSAKKYDKKVDIFESICLQKY